ncbi:MAG TPA: hypothetical protein VK327_00910 [Candidatus Paceibacterota bacterium]|nr:hypothetical protein [Candidatus Paceibacterota bacterium]
MHATIPNRGVPVVAQKVLVVYETLPAREQSAYLCSGDSNTTVRWCSAPRLNEPEYADETARHAATADMIIFAGDREGDFSPEVKVWIERWLFKRSAREGAIVGLFNSGTGSGAKVSSLKEIYLRRAAHEAGLDYLSHLPSGPIKTIPNSLETYSERAGQVTSVLHNILAGGLPPTPPLL